MTWKSGCPKNVHEISDSKGIFQRFCHTLFFLHYMVIYVHHNGNGISHKLGNFFDANLRHLVAQAGAVIVTEDMVIMELAAQ